MQRGPLSLYFQVGAVVRERIRVEQYPPGGRLPTEDQLQTEFGVSRTTVRLALDTLQRDGLIVRYAGRGTFVTGAPDRPRTLRFGGSIEELIAHGTQTDFLVSHRAIGPATPGEAGELKIDQGQAVMRITGIRLSNDVRVAHVNVIVPEVLGVLLRVQAGQRYPPVAAMLQQLGQSICEARQIIGVAVASQEIAAVLNVPPGAPLLQIRRTYFAADGAPVEFAVSCYPGDLYRYEATIST